jgi:uncharacterized repeat protein (TIGR01451 family)
MRKIVRFMGILLSICLLFCQWPGLVQAAAGEDLTISSNTSWSSGNYTYNNVTIRGNATLTFNGSVSLTCANLTIDSGSSISANGTGNGPASGPGSGVNVNPTGGANGSGGGYGGKGGKGNGGSSGGGIYGSATRPVDFGSGGGPGGGNGGPGGAGGGAIRLNVSNTLTNSGMISANGTNAVNTGGGGSGGSIWVTATVLAGAGAFKANGGGALNSGGGGGGGRIAIYYNSSAFAGSIEAKGGPINVGGYGQVGQDGTAGLFDTVHNNLAVVNYFRFQEDDGPFNLNQILLDNAKASFQGSTPILKMGDLTLINSSFVYLNHEEAPQGIVILNAQNVSVDATSKIGVDGGGYSPGEGPGQGVDAGVYAGGGGYGGKGGAGQWSAGGSTYGSTEEPVDPGSGGGNSTSNGSLGGAGGGAIRLIVSNTLTNNGLISANGSNGSGNSGGGSGGSLWVTTDMIGGSGFFKADGGAGAYGGGGGGGGRIAIYYQSSSFNGSVEAKAGVGNNGGLNGYDGTAGLLDTTNNTLRVVNYFRFQEEDGPFNFNKVILDSAKASFQGATVTLTVGDLALDHNSSLFLAREEAPQGTIRITANNIALDDTSNIRGDMGGYGSATGPGTGGYASAYAGGAGYGGKGGAGQWGAGGTTYGSATRPVDLGSGGANDADGLGGLGGGAIRLIVSNALNNNGFISANGGIGEGNAGGGSGGSLWIIAKTLTGTGSFKADGGDGGYGAGGGGGGRIAIYYQSSDFNGAIEAKAGLGHNGGLNGADGTAGLFDTANNNLKVINYFRFQTDDGPFNFNEVTLDNAKASFQGSTASMTVGDLMLANNSSLYLTREEFSGGIFSLSAIDLTIDATSKITADGVGYGSSTGPGAGIDTATNTGGGGYGGKGGNGQGSAGGGTYGLADAPVDFGSGGGKATSWNQPGGAGGAAIRIIVSDNFTNNGLITANGSDGAGYSGGGSGGSIWVTTNIFAGAGYFKANGGNTAHAGGGGGGGRIAINYQTSTFSGGCEVSGGGFGYQGGDSGTIRMLQGSISRQAETRSIGNNFSETLVIQKATANNATVSGILTGTFNFTQLEMDRVKGGAFAGNGFSRGTWTATLNSLSYAGDWRGIFFFSPADGRIYLKGTTSGDVNGIIDGYLAESIMGSGIYDSWTATWNAKILGYTTTTTLDLSGTFIYGEVNELAGTQFKVLQTAVDGSSSGLYVGPLSTVLTQVRVSSVGSPHFGEGFSIMSYTSSNASGEGWAYNHTIAPNISELNGFFTAPLTGIATGILDETTTPRNLSFSIGRFDQGETPAADIHLEVIGPTRVSPGQTITYSVVLRNDGLVASDDLVLVLEPDLLSSILTVSGDGFYDNRIHMIRWDIGGIAPGTVVTRSVQVTIFWGLTSGTQLEVGASLLPRALAEPIFQHNSPSVNPWIQQNADDIWHSIMTLEQTPAAQDRIINENTGIQDILRGRIEYALRSGKLPPGPMGTYLMRFLDYLKIMESDPPVILFSLGNVTNNIPDNTYPLGQNIAESFADGTIPLNIPDGYYQVTTPTSIAVMQNEFYIFINTITYGTESEKNEALKNHPNWANYTSKDDWQFVKPNIDGEVITDVQFENYSPQTGTVDVTVNMKMTYQGRNFGNITLKQTTNNPGSFVGVLRNNVTQIFNSTFTQYHDKYWLQHHNITMCDLITQLSNNSGYYYIVNFPIEFMSIISPAKDPNIKYGPEGNVQAGQQLEYKVEYENTGEGIAFGVYFTDTLDKDLDDSTLSIGSVFSTGVGGEKIAEAGTYNPLTRTITWYVGEVGSLQGGYAEFNINVRADASDGTEINNYGIVYFPSVPEVTPTNTIHSTIGIPIASPGTEYTGFEGSPITLDASASYDPDNQPLQYRWDFDNDGIWDTTWSSSPTIEHIWSDNLSSHVRVEVSDGQVSRSDAATLVVNNVAPTVDLESLAPISNGEALSQSCSFTDPGNDQWAVLIDYGDGSAVNQVNPGSSKTFDLNHTYSNSGTYTITVNVIDDDADIGAGQVTITVEEGQPPVLNTVKIASNNADPTLAKVRDTVSLTLAASTNIKTPIVNIAGHAAVISGADQNWIATYTMGSTDSEGVVAFSIDFSDLNNIPGTLVTTTIDGSAVTFDKTSPTLAVTNPPSGWALQNHVTFSGNATDSGSGVKFVSLSIRKGIAAPGQEVGCENLEASYDSTNHIWTLVFNTLSLKDEFYVAIVKVADKVGNTASATVYCSIRNWAVLKLLPATESNKAGRTVPVKFSLRVASAVDPKQPFIYNEELIIKVLASKTPGTILQQSTFGKGSQNYRIDSASQKYITNFQTEKTPLSYTVEVYNGSLMVGSFTFQTSK